MVSISIPGIIVNAIANRIIPSRADIKLPALLVNSRGAGRSVFTLPNMAVSVTDSYTAYSDVNIYLPGLIVSATAMGYGEATATVLLPALIATIKGGQSVRLKLPKFIVSGSASRLNISEVGLLLSDLTVFARADRLEASSVTLVLPNLIILNAKANLVIPKLSLKVKDGYLFQNSIAYVLNIRTNEVTKYSNMNFMHIVSIGDKYYGVKADGLYLLEGSDDNGTAINGTIITKETDFGSFQHKRLQYIYLNSDTQTMITAYFDGVQGIPRLSGNAGRKVKLSLGNRGRYWKLKIENIIKIEGVEMIPMKIQRRI
jgi:hypothetical protein